MRRKTLPSMVNCWAILTSSINSLLHYHHGRQTASDIALYDILNAILRRSDILDVVRISRRSSWIGPSSHSKSWFEYLKNVIRVRQRPSSAGEAFNSHVTWTYSFTTSRTCQSHRSFKQALHCLVGQSFCFLFPLGFHSASSRPRLISKRNINGHLKID